MTERDAMENAAVRACRDGGAYLRTAFRADDRAADFTAHDAKAAADRESERRMLDVVLDAFPDHHVYAEESGDHPGDGPYRWIVDPLDGTNNFTAGIPSFATSVAVVEDGEPVLAVVYVPMLDDLYVARRGEGVRYDGERVTAGSDRDLDAATVGFVVGHDVKRDDDRWETSRAIRSALEERCKRVIDTWSPCVYWALLARGLIDGMVTYHADQEEQLAGELFASEAGVCSRSRGGRYVAAGDDASLSDLWETVSATS